MLLADHQYFRSHNSSNLFSSSLFCCTEKQINKKEAIIGNQACAGLRPVCAWFKNLDELDILSFVGLAKQLKLSNGYTYIATRVHLCTYTKIALEYTVVTCQPVS